MDLSRDLRTVPELLAALCSSRASAGSGRSQPEICPIAECEGWFVVADNAFGGMCDRLRNSQGHADER